MATVSLTAGEEQLNGHGYYSGSEAARLARIPNHTLYSWRRQGIVVPSIRWTDTQGHAELGYSFYGVVYLRLLRMLRDTAIPLERAVLAVSELVKRFGPPGPRWEEARIFAEGSHVYVHARDEWQTTVATRGSQKLWDELYGEEFARLRNRTDALLVPRRYQPYVEIDPHVRNGLPVVRTTAFLTQVVHALRLQGRTFEEIVADYPLLTSAQVKGAHAYESFLDAEALVA